MRNTCDETIFIIKEKMCTIFITFFVFYNIFYSVFYNVNILKFYYSLYLKISLFSFSSL